MSFHSFKPTTYVSSVVHQIPRYLVPLALLLTTYLYLYPIFLGCVFPSTDGVSVTAFKDTIFQHVNRIDVNPLDSRPQLAPFRLLVLADPQIEGDSSLPDPEDALGNKIAKHWARVRALELANISEFGGVVQEVLEELISQDVPSALQAMRKRLDLFGNDYYLAHIFRTLHWWTKPTHVTVLGDLIGSQWVEDDEFEWRGWRYWNRVMAGGERVSDQIMALGSQGGGISIMMDDPAWRTRIVNIAGNHDIGYAGDITKERMSRFEEKYGKANWDIRFQYPSSRMMNTSADVPPPMLHLVILNSMLLDTPVMDETLQQETYAYLNEVISQRLQPVDMRSDFTLLLTHVPLHKKEGTCVDAPLFAFWDEDECSAGDCKVGGLKEQNHLSEFVSYTGTLQSLFGMSGDLDRPEQGRGRPGLVLTGHDHEGCDVYHYIPRNSTFRKSEHTDDVEETKITWETSVWKHASTVDAHTGIREVTLRSMMGEFGGNAGLLSAWFDFEKGEWEYDIQMCRLGVQHIWWAIHIVDLVAIGSVLLSLTLKILQRPEAAVVKKPDEKKKSLKTE